MEKHYLTPIIIDSDTVEKNEFKTVSLTLRRNTEDNFECQFYHEADYDTDPEVKYYTLNVGDTIIIRHKFIAYKKAYDVDSIKLEMNEISTGIGNKIAAEYDKRTKERENITFTAVICTFVGILIGYLLF
jgi:hypothetical protein